MTEQNRDIIAVGGSAGSLDVLKALLRALPDDLPASVLIVWHSNPSDRSFISEILSEYSSLPVAYATDGEKLSTGRVYLAPPDQHLLLGEGHLHLRRGPRENNFRPAVDPLFRSAALYRSSRVIGVVLSGYLDDGASGLKAITESGGVGVVQDPRDAAFPDMPLAAINAGAPKHIVAAEDLGPLCNRLCREASGPACQVPESVRLEVTVAGLEEASMETEFKLGELSPYNCPDCNGVLWEIKDGKLLRFRCHTGHAYSSAALLDAQSAALERRLYEALRGQRERSRLLRRLSKRASSPRQKELWERRAAEYDRDSKLVEKLLTQNAEAALDPTEVD